MAKAFYHAGLRSVKAVTKKAVLAAIRKALIDPQASQTWYKPRLPVSPSE
jgi:hypothetical protein